jgi:multiple antibiotic resistance protein
MVFEKRTERREKRAEEVRTAAEVDDVSVFPLAIPMIAGPGSIATIMLLMSRAAGTQATLVILAALGAVMLLCLAALLAARQIMRLVGAKAEAVVTRLLGVLLGALAAQYVIDGLRAVLSA